MNVVVLLHAAVAALAPTPAPAPTHDPPPPPPPPVVQVAPCSPTEGEQWLVDHESDGNVNARNPSGAFGLGQLMPGNRQRYGARLGVSPDTTNYCDQLNMMRDYVGDRYGSTANAVSHWRESGWY